VLKLEEFQVHDVSTVLRRFIRSLDEPVLTEALRPQWINTASKCAHRVSEKLGKIVFLDRTSSNFHQF